MEEAPPTPHDQRRARRERYRLRILACLAASLGVLIAAVRLWPAFAPSNEPAPRHYVDDAVAVREITQTAYARRTSPPPPPPPVPIFEVDELIEQEPLDFTVELVPGEAPSEAPPGPPNPHDGEAETSSAVAPDVGARQMSVVEPEYTKAARDEGVRARVDVEVVVAPTGRVTEAAVVRRVVLSGSGDAAAQRVVSALGYGLEEAALDAAQRTLFRPARAGDRAVESRKTITITLGPGD